MDELTSSFLSRVAAALATGMITGTGRWAREKLGTPEREKALGQCNWAGLEALVRDGVPEDAEHREHVGDVIEEFFRTPAPQVKLLERLRAFVSVSCRGHCEPMAPSVAPLGLGGIGGIGNPGLTPWATRRRA